MKGEVILELACPCLYAAKQVINHIINDSHLNEPKRIYWLGQEISMDTGQ